MLNQPYLLCMLGIDVDCKEQRVYWGDVLGNAIKSAYYNGTNETTFLNIGKRTIPHLYITIYETHEAAQ